MQDFAHHGFGLMLDFFNQNILFAHGFNYQAKTVFGKPPIVHPKMNPGKEFPSACIRFPSSPSIVRRATRPVRFHLISARQVAPAEFGMRL
jgi:hypothetical protein